MAALQLLEQYEGLIESNPSEISIVWKGSSVLVYFVSSLASYSCAILFYVFWYDICGGHCVFWAEAQLVPGSSPQPPAADPSANATMKSRRVSGGGSEYDWTKDVQVTYLKEKQAKCKWFHITCLISCYVSTTGLIMFFMCGKGGYDNNNLFTSPWRLVLPWLVVSLVLMFMTMSWSFSFSSGYYHFSQTLFDGAHTVLRRRNSTTVYHKPCQAVQAFTQGHNIQDYNLCAIEDGVKITSLIMTWCWICGFAILVLRILATVDFTLLKVKVYRIPDEEPERTRILETIYQGSQIVEFQQERKDRVAKNDKTLTVTAL